MPATLSNAEIELVTRLKENLTYYSFRNAEAKSFYEAKRLPDVAGSTIPPHMRNLRITFGWPAKVVDVLEQRLDFEGWTHPEFDDPFGLQEIFNANCLDADASLAHLDALLYGTGFVVIGTGNDGEADPLITVESPTNFTALANARTRRLDAALGIHGNAETLYLANETLYFERAENGTLNLLDRRVHNLGRVPVVQFANRPRSGRPGGRSEITGAVRTQTDEATRTAISMAVNRELYSAPARVILGADESAFLNADGSPKSQMSLYMDRILALSSDEDGNVPTVQQLAQGSPEPFIAILDQYARQVAAESGIPVRYFGITTSAPTSADAIRADESELIKKAERRQSQFGRSWTEVARVALLVRDGVVPEGFSSVRPQWRDASTPTKAASADATVKLVSAGVLPATSDVVLDYIGLGESDKARVRSERARVGSLEMIDSMINGEAAPLTEGGPSAQDEANTLKAKFEALGMAVRAGVEPTYAARLLGLDGIELTGGTPTSLKFPEDDE